MNLVAGSYTLKIADTTQAGTYSFLVLNLADATATAYGNVNSGELNPPSATNAYRFDAEAGDELYFDVVAASDVNCGVSTCRPLWRRCLHVEQLTRFPLTTTR